MTAHESYCQLCGGACALAATPPTPEQAGPSGDRLTDAVRIAASIGLGVFPAKCTDDEARQWLAAKDSVCGDDDAAEEEALRERMGDLLTRTVNALRGEPPPLTLWSWHDLPELAASLRSAALASPGAMEGAQAAQPTAAAIWQGGFDEGVEWIRASEVGSYRAPPSNPYLAK